MAGRLGNQSKAAAETSYLRKESSGELRHRGLTLGPGCKGHGSKRDNALSFREADDEANAHSIRLRGPHGLRRDQ
jgi:hypothetical protein